MTCKAVQIFSDMAKISSRTIRQTPDRRCRSRRENINGNYRHVKSFHSIFAPAIMEIKERILNHSTTLFLRNGIKSVSMDDIAASMAMSKKTLYKWFENKDQ